LPIAPPAQQKQKLPCCKEVSIKLWPENIDFSFFISFLGLYADGNSIIVISPRHKSAATDPGLILFIRIIGTSIKRENHRLYAGIVPTQWVCGRPASVANQSGWRWLHDSQ
jgi:hypothetical protein